MLVFWVNYFSSTSADLLSERNKSMCTSKLNQADVGAGEFNSAHQDKRIMPAKEKRKTRAMRETILF